MLKKITPTRVTIKETKPDGTPWNYGSVSVGLQTANSQDWINGFTKKDRVPKEGEEIELEIWKDDRYGWKFKMPTKTDELEGRVKTLELQVSVLMGQEKSRSENPGMLKATELPVTSGEASKIPGRRIEQKPHVEQSVASHNREEQTFQKPLEEGDPGYTDVKDIPF